MEWVIVGIGGKTFPSISSGRKTDTMKRGVSPSRAWPDPSLAVVLDPLGPMLWQVGGICD